MITTRTSTASGLAAAATARPRATATISENRTDLLAARGIVRKPAAATAAVASHVPQRRALVDRTNVVVAPAATAIGKRPAAGAATTTVSKPKEDEPFVAPTVFAADVPLAAHQILGPAPMPTSMLPTHHAEEDDDFADTQACAEHAEDIMAHFRSKELAYMVAADYLSGMATDITPRMRAILLDWLVEVHLKFRLTPESMYLTVSIIDRYLAKTPATPRSKLQLVGITAMLVASKYEEIYAPELRDFIFICNRAYTRPEILEMESAIVATLDFALIPPHGLHFLRRFTKVAHSNLEEHTTAKYLLELATLDYSTTGYYPSALAAAALNLSMKICKFSDASGWNPTMVYYSRYTEEQLAPIVALINSLHVRASEVHKAVYKKYNTRDTHNVASKYSPLPL